MVDEVVERSGEEPQQPLLVNDLGGSAAVVGWRLLLLRCEPLRGGAGGTQQGGTQFGRAPSGWQRADGSNS